ncbi:ADP-ribosylglycohydrolase family protein [bacterium]|nr:ADP-ribosylglycohydrolase family protein [bacterium]
MISRYAGCLLGLAIGDALGAPLEGMKEGHIQQVFGEVADYVDPVAAFPDRPARWRLKGLYTDDTQQALAVADVLAIYGGADPSRLADLYLRLWREGSGRSGFGAHRGTGRFFRQAVEAMAEAEDPRECGQLSAGNGAAMRIAPVGLFCRSDVDDLARAAIDFSLMTHHDSRGVAAALAMAWSVARLSSVTGVKGEMLEVARELADWLPPWEETLFREYPHFLHHEVGRDRLHHVSEMLGLLPVLLSVDNEALVSQTIVAEANKRSPEVRISHPQAGFALASVTMALYRGLSANSFVNGVIVAINGGGDTDTVVAMAGALLGARFGEEAIPAEWISGLVNAEQVRARALALHDRGVDWSIHEDYVEMEKALSEREAVAAGLASDLNREEIEKRNRRKAQQRKVREARQTTHVDPGCAPPPEVWLRAENRAVGREEMDPEEARRERSRRGRKRIGWKDERRGKGPGKRSEE